MFDDDVVVYSSALRILVRILLLENITLLLIIIISIITAILTIILCINAYWQERINVVLRTTLIIMY